MLLSVIFLPVITLLNTPYLSSSTPAMSGIDLDTMKQLLADQRKDLISDMKEQISSEVAVQLAPHADRLDQLHDDQMLLKKQLSEISDQLQLKPQSNPVPAAPHLPVSAPVPTPAQHIPQPIITSSPHSLSQEDITSIEAAKCTLNFSPVSNDDLNRLKTNENESVTTEELLTRAIHEFLEVNMNIPTQTISRMMIKTISHYQEIDFQRVTVEFTNICPVNTIFKYVKNLSPEQKVSLYIPPVLEPRHEELKNYSYHLRNSEPRHKTVIKFLGYDLALYSKKPSQRNWLHVTNPSLYPVRPSEHQKRNREESDTEHDDEPKKSKKYEMTAEIQPLKAQTSGSGLPKPQFKTVPSHSKPLLSPCHTPGGGFWQPDDPRSPAPKTDSGNC